MFEAIFGNKNVERVLLFLFVNGKCYGCQLQRQLNISLTPLQKALQRLEKGGIIHSYFEGKTKLYYFNHAFPLLNELELLLKKIYNLLPTSEKKTFYARNQSDLMNVEKKLNILLNFWNLLKNVSTLSFNAKSKSTKETGWNGRGHGEVSVTINGDNQIIFHEKGIINKESSPDINFSNVFRWTFDRFSGVIALEHLRYGPNNPIFLFHLAPTSYLSLSSVDSHLCHEDSYYGHITFDQFYLKFDWRVIGPSKNEEIDYYYKIHTHR